MRIRTIALALALGCGAGMFAQAATNPKANFAKQRAKQNKRAIRRRVKSLRSQNAKVKRQKPRKSA